MSLDSIAYCLRRGESTVEGKERLVQGTIDYIRAHQAEVDAYLEEGERLWEQLCRKNPLPPSLEEKIRRYRLEKGLKSA